MLEQYNKDNFLNSGVQSLGKAAYVITLSPYVVLTILIAYVATLDGASDGDINR